MNENSVLPRKLIPWLLLGMLAAVVALSVGVLKAVGATDRTTSENSALRGRLDRLSGEVADLQRETDVKSQQLRDAGIPESPLAVPKTVPPVTTTTTTTTVPPRPTTTSTTPPSSTTTTGPPPSTTTTTACAVSVLGKCVP